MPDRAVNQIDAKPPGAAPEAAPGARLPGLLSKLGKLTAIRDTELLEHSLLKTLGPMLGVATTSLYRLDEDAALARVIHYYRAREALADGEESIVERIEEVLDARELPAEIAALTANVRLLGRPCSQQVAAGRVAIAYPLLGDGEICGYFVFHHGREVSPAEDAIIRGVLEVFSNYYALLDVSLRDRLTGLFNRQALENSFDRLWTALARPADFDAGAHGRQPTPSNRYWLAMIDIDHFKKINDMHGHMVGDEILLLVARLMDDTFRSSDLLYRYGGEEFAAIVSANGDEDAARIFERLRKTVEAHVFPRVGRLTISIGYCRATSDFLPQEILARADRSLYEAKRQGRNLVCEYENLVRSGIFQETTYGDLELF